MSCTIWFSDSPDHSWSTQNIRYSWLIAQATARLRPDETDLRRELEVSAVIHLLDLPALRRKDPAQWKRAVDVLARVIDDIVQGRLPAVLEADQLTDSQLHYAELQRLLQDHLLEVPGPKRPPLPGLAPGHTPLKQPEMNQIEAMEAKILAGYRQVLAAPAAKARQFKLIAISLMILGVCVAAVSGHLVGEMAQYDAGQMLAVLSGVLIGLSLLFFINSQQMLTFAKFCTLKPEYLEQTKSVTADPDRGSA